MEKEIVKIHNKDYETVASRVKRFREDKPDWCIDTVVQAFIDGVLCKTSIKDETCRVRATGIAHEKESSSHINKTSYIENCETSAIGRALACLGYLGTEFCSADELTTALKNQPQVERGIEQGHRKPPAPVKSGDFNINDLLGFGKNSDFTWATVKMEYLGWLAGQDGNKAGLAKKAIQIRMANEAPDNEMQIAPDDDNPIFNENGNQV